MAFWTPFGECTGGKSNDTTAMDSTGKIEIYCVDDVQIRVGNASCLLLFQSHSIAVTNNELRIE